MLLSESNPTAPSGELHELVAVKPCALTLLLDAVVCFDQMLNRWLQNTCGELEPSFLVFALIVSYQAAMVKRRLLRHRPA